MSPRRLAVEVVDEGGGRMEPRIQTTISLSPDGGGWTGMGCSADGTEFVGCDHMPTWVAAAVVVAESGTEARRRRCEAVRGSIEVQSQ